MKNLIFAFVFSLLFFLPVLAQPAQINIIPQPISVQKLNGNFVLNRKTKIFADDDEGRRLADFFNEHLQKNYNFKLKVTAKKPIKDFIAFLPTSTAISHTINKNEAYFLRVETDSIKMDGIGAGRFYALQSLIQLLPLEFKNKAEVPAVFISDAPRFKYRGMHLDVSRHFMPLAFVKKYIDLMAQYKFNQFHWHLTDDQGWRIEIKKYPRLTEIGSRRKESHEGKYSTTFKGDGVPVSGFYTQDEIREVVRYAKDRKINVIPEIELPGHASAALAAYPELGCKENYEYKVQQTWGIFKEVFCPTETTFKFLEDVLAETIALFPDSPYIHIGGDEVLKDHWKESAFVQELKTKENLKDEHEVQSYFIRRMEKFVNSKGKKIIGWDEISEGGIAPNATIMSWRGEKGGIDAAKAKHDVIMTPNTFLYFDYGQGDPKTEPLNIGGFLPLEKVYSYDPIPKELLEDEKRYILGAQANIWTEYLEKPENVEYMAFPRMLALAEVVWSPIESKNYTNFRARLAHHFARLDKQNVNYRIPEPANLQNYLLTGEQDTVQLIIGGGINEKVFYTIDGSEPTEKSAILPMPSELKLKQNEKIDLKTIVINGKGRKSSVYSATILRRSPLESFGKTIDKNNYVNFSYYKNSFKSVKEMDTIEPTEEGTSKSIGLTQFAAKQDLKEPFGVVFDGLLSVPSDEIYEFQLESDDGASLTIGDGIIIDNDGLHSLTSKSDIIPLKKGFHKVRLKYFQNGGDANFTVRWGIKGTALQRINGSEFYN